MTRRAAIVGNWKMNGLKAQIAEARALAQAFSDGLPDGLISAICPPATILAQLAEAFEGSPFAAGGQDCAPQASGAHTGDISAEMLADLGARYVIVGHSERRADHGETDAQVRAKAEAAQRAGLTPIICVGETEAERDAGRAEEVVASQATASTPDGALEAGAILAYEPVWAIGTGRTPTLDDIAAMHASLRTALGGRFGDDAAAATPLLYGGSMKPANAADILAINGVDGGLIGGASLKAADFGEIIKAYATI